MEDTDYKPPILASIFRLFGWLDIVAAVVVFFVGITSDSGAGVGSGIVAACGCLGSALVLLGLSQVIDYIGQIAHYTRLGYEQAGRYGNLGTHWDKEALVALKATADHTKRALSQSLPAKSPPPPVPNGVGPASSRFYYLSPEAQPTGPVSTAELKQLFQDAVLEPDSLVCAEGGDMWKPLTKAIIL